MWLRFALLLIIGAALADHDHAWEKGNEYQFLMHSRTLTDVGELTKEYAGILIKGDLIVQAISSDTLQAVFSKPQYARVHRELPEGWDSKISVETLEPHDLPMSGKPFKIKLKHGVIRDLMVEKGIPTWEINLIKSMISQLQVDTQGENRIKSRNTQVPDDEHPFAMFSAMEDSVAGKCEVLYDIMPLSETTLHDRPELVPLPELRGDGHFLDIIKTKNFTRCETKVRYQFGIGGKVKWSPMSNPSHAGYVSRTTMSRMVISGNLKHFTIQSSVTVDKTLVSHKKWTGTVHSKVNVTLDKVNKISTPLPVSEDLVSTGNLVYTFNDPFSDVKKHKASPSIARNSMPVISSESSHSSSEERFGGKDPMDSSSSDDSSISLANSNERSYLRSKPSLDQVPATPMLPYFVGYKGKAIHDSEKVDAVEAAARMIKMIPEQIEHTRRDSRSLGLLEQFTILSKLIRTMNTKQIAQLEEKVATIMKEVPDNVQEDMKEHLKQNYEDVLRDALTQAGTGPSFMTLRKWIKEKKLKGEEAARIVSRLPKTVRVPTAEYIQAFFEMITQPEVMQQRYLNTTAPLAFAELVFYAQVSETEHYNRYPVFTFGRMVPKEDRAVVETYIPYMAKQLKEAIKDGDSPRIQTYIFALGHFGHPKVLSVFEPYLEGTVPVSTYQRMMMVFSLYKLVETNPKMVRSVAYKIYLNTREADEVRTTAVFMVLKTNPPLAIMQRMAAFTNHDDSKQVNAMVRNIIEKLANSKMEEPQWQDLVHKARIVKDLLKPQEYDEKYSQVFFGKFAAQNAVYKLAMFILGSDDSYLPKAEYLNLGISYGAYNLPNSEIGYAVSSMKQFLAIWDMLEHKDDTKQHKPSAVEKIVRALDIHPEDPQQLEGNIYWNTFYDARFHPFDNHTIERIVETWSEKFMKMMEPGPFHFKHMNYLESYDITVGFPMESGMPFIYTIEAPRMMKLSGEGKLNVKPMEGFTTNMNIAGHFVLAETVMDRIGFMTPFDHHEYIAGVDQGWQLFLPFGFEAKFEPAQKNIQVKLHPDNYYKYGHDMITMGISIIPYTSTYDILHLQPIIQDKGTKIAFSKKPQNIELNVADNIHVSISSDLIEAEGNDFESRYDMLTGFFGDNANYKKLNIVLKSLPGQVNITFDVVETDANSKGDHETWPTMPTMVDKEPDSEARRHQFIKEVSKDINSATNYVVDVDVFLPTVMRNREIFTIGISESNVDEKSRGLLFWKQVPKSTENSENEAMEICVAGMMRSMQDIFLEPEKALKRIPTDEFNVEMQIGKTCEDGVHVKFEGNMTRSDDFTEMIMDSEEVEKCRHEMKQGNKGMRACQEVIALANIKNHAIMSMDIKSKHVRDVMNQLIRFASQKVLTDESVEIVSSTEDERKTMELEVKISPDFETAEAILRMEGINIKFDPLDVSGTRFSPFENQIDKWLEEEEEPETSCTLDKTEVLTFDNNSYPVKLGKCWHAMMTTYSKKNPENMNEFMPIPEEMQLAVLVKDTDDTHRQIRIIMGDTEIAMHKSGDHVEATFNGEKVHFSQYKSHRVKEDDETIIEIFELPDGSIKVMSEKYEMNAVYDGERVRLQLSHEYFNDVRGLCGTYDGHPEDDFTTPKNCILKKPEEFTATYAITHESCEGPAVENKQKAEQSKCIHMHERQSNVVSDREAGRPWIENKKWGYHHMEHMDHKDAHGKRCTLYRTQIVEEGDEICFTTRPVPICAEGCKPTEIKTKKYPLHCTTKSVSSMHLKKRIEQGANPDMTQRSVSKSHSFEVPLGCIAA